MTTSSSCVTERIIWSYCGEAFWKMTSNFGSQTAISKYLVSSEYLFSGNKMPPPQVSETRHQKTKGHPKIYWALGLRLSLINTFFFSLETSVWDDEAVDKTSRRFSFFSECFMSHSCWCSQTCCSQCLCSLWWRIVTLTLKSVTTTCLPTTEVSYTHTHT